MIVDEVNQLLTDLIEEPYYFAKIKIMRNIRAKLEELRPLEEVGKEKEKSYIEELKELFD